MPTLQKQDRADAGHLARSSVAAGKVSELFRVVRQIDDDVLRLFGAEALPDETMEATASRMLASFHEAASDIQGVEVAFDREFEVVREQLAARTEKP